MSKLKTTLVLLLASGVLAAQDPKPIPPPVTPVNASQAAVSPTQDRPELNDGQPVAMGLIVQANFHVYEKD
jgi:hypothetical protein